MFGYKVGDHFSINCTYQTDHPFQTQMRPILAPVNEIWNKQLNILGEYVGDSLNIKNVDILSTTSPKLMKQWIKTGIFLKIINKPCCAGKHKRHFENLVTTWTRDLRTWRLDPQGSKLSLRHFMNYFPWSELLILKTRMYFQKKQRQYNCLLWYKCIPI